MPCPIQNVLILKPPHQVIGGDIRQAFSNVRVDRAKLAIAVRALGRTRPGYFNYRVANGEVKGVKMENLDAAADLICRKLGLMTLQNRDTVRNALKLLAFSEKSTAKLEDVSLDDGFKSIYGYVTGVQNSQGYFDIAYTVHQQEFTVEQASFSVEEVEAIQMHYLKHVALLYLKQENVIQSISYV